MPDPAPLVNEVDLFGWDTAYAVRLGVINDAIKKAQCWPTRFEQHDSEHGFVLQGSFEQWQIVPGGSGELVNLLLPVPDCQFINPGHPPITLQGSVVVAVRLDFVDHPVDGGAPAVQQSALKVRLTPVDDAPAVLVQSVTFAETNVDFMARAMFKSMLQDWLVAHLEDFDHIFARIDINRQADHAGFQWMQPTARAYAYGTQDEGEPVLAILAMTGGRALPKGLAQQVSGSLVPKGQTGALGISRRRIIEELILPALPAVFKGTQPDDFSLSQDGQTISLARRAVDFSASDPQSGKTHACTLDALTITLSGDRIDFFAQSQTEPVTHFHAHCSVRRQMTVTPATRADGPGLSFADIAPPVTKHWIDTDSGIEIEDAVTMAVGAVIVFILTLLTEGAALLPGLMLLGLLYGAMKTSEEAVERLERNDAPALTLSAAQGTAAIAWTDQDEFALATAQLNGALVMGGTVAAGRNAPADGT